MKTNLLPNYVKKIAIPVGAVSLIGLMLSGYLADFLSLDKTMISWILKDLILVSLLILVFSEEKKESAKIKSLRSRQLIDSIGFGVVILILDSLFEIIFWDDKFEMKSGYELMVGVLLYYLILFSIRKNIKEPKGSTV